MRLLVLISGLLASGAGAFCFAFYTSTFYDVAFLVGVVMCIDGVCNTIAYMVSGRGARRLTETTLVEGLVTLLYGVAVLSNQVTESMLTMFFGTWLTLCGVTRFSQSLYVSRFNPRDWSKIIPLSLISATLGVVMMLPGLVSSVMPLMLVGGAFLFDGLSMIIYAMYMKDSTKDMAVGEARARVRAEAKKEEHEAKIAERERLRHLSKEEREKEEKKRRKRERAEERKRAEQRAAARAAMMEAVRPKEDRTIKLTEKEVEEINANAPEEVADATPIDMSDDVEPKTEETLPVFEKPENFTLHTEEKQEEKHNPAIDVQVKDMPAFNAINLEELENEIPPVEFEKIELPKVEFESDKQEVNRDDVIAEITSLSVDSGEKVEYEKIDLEALVAEPLAKRQSPSDATRFTQTLDFTWVKRVNDVLDKRDDI